MHGLYEALLSACDNYQVMQQAHLHCLATEAQPDIERLVFEREHLFAKPPHGCSLPGAESRARVISVPILKPV